MVSAFNEIRSDRAASSWPSKLSHLPDSQPWNLRWVSRNRDRRSIRFIRGSSVSCKVFLGEPRPAPRLPVVLGIAGRRSPPSGSPSVFTRDADLHRNSGEHGPARYWLIYCFNRAVRSVKVSNEDFLV